MSTTHTSFDQYRPTALVTKLAAAAPGPEVRRECPMTQFQSLPLLATNRDDVTVRHGCIDDINLFIYDEKGRQNTGR